MNEQYYFFWKNGLSNWKYSPFVNKEGIKFADNEMYMMWGKAMLFNDTETAEKILRAKTPAVSKRLGREVKGFDQATWDFNAMHIVKEGARLKFEQHPDLKRLLLSTEGYELLVEASPFDHIGGIKMNATEARKTPRHLWRGLNLLGEVLTELRDDFILGR